MNNMYEYWTKPEYFTVSSPYYIDKAQRNIDAWTRVFFSVLQPIQMNKTYRIQGFNSYTRAIWWCLPTDGSDHTYQTDDINEAYKERQAREMICSIQSYSFQVFEYHEGDP